MYVFDLKIVFCGPGRLCGALLSYFELHFGSQEAPWGLFGVANGSFAAHNHSTDSMDRDFGALEDLLEALLVASRCPRDLHSLQI